ncbi:MAG: hypothetical protein JSU01_06710, partial [Bacteroidetes bacterium]|nr:hypothetical protein [Bacteroidota bacterium]
MPLQITQDLIEANIITKEEEPKLEKQINAFPGAEFRAIYIFFYEKTFGEEYPSGPMFFSYRVTEPNKEANIVELKKLLDILTGNDLLEDITFRKLSTEISNYNIVNNFHLIYRAGGLNHFYKNFTKKNQHQFAEQLIGTDFRNRVLDERKRAKLNKDIENGVLGSYRDFLRYCYNCKFVEFRPDEKRYALLKRVLILLDKLSSESFLIEKFGYEISEDIEISSKSGQAVNLSLQIGNKIYKHSYELREDLISEFVNHSYDIENLLQLLNDIVVDFNLSYRFVLVVDTSETSAPVKNESEFAICWVTQQTENLLELREFRKRFWLVKPHYQFWPKLSYTHIQYSIYHYKKSGVLDHLSKKEIYDV